MKKISTVTYFYVLACLLPLALYLQSDYIQNSPSLNAALPALGKAAAVILFLVGILGWKLNQSRILLSSSFFLAAYYLLLLPMQSGFMGMQERELIESVSLALPISLCLGFLIPEKALFTQTSLLRLGLCLLPLILLIGLNTQAHEHYFSLMNWKRKSWINLALPFASLGAWLALPALAYFKHEPKIRPYLQAMAFSTLPVFLATDSGMKILDIQPFKPGMHIAFTQFCFLCAAVMQAYAIFSMYWQRVYMDELTGIPNRRALDERLQSLSAPYALAMADIDHFKRFNDSYGHDEGDNVLRLVAGHLAHESNDRAYRYGGEEFCLIFEGWDTEKAALLCDMARQGLAKREFSIRLPAKIRKKTSPKDRGSLKAKTENVKITLSLGVAEPEGPKKTPQDVIKLADQRLYKAKEAGRNRVVQD